MKHELPDIRNLMTAGLTCLLAFSMAHTPVHAADAPEADSAQQQLETINEAILHIEQWLQSTRQQRSAEEQSLLESSQQINALRQNILTNQRQLTALENDLAQLAIEQNSLLADSEQQRAQIASTLVASYISGADSQLKLLLNQQDPAIARRMLVYFEAFNQQRIAHITRWRDTLAELAENRQTLQSTADQLNALNNSQLEQQRSLQAQQLSRETLIAELSAQMDERGTELETLLADQLELQTLINEINSVLIDLPASDELMPFADSRGNMPWPSRGRLLAAYGDAYSAGQLRRQGIIIESAPGSPVRAVHPGRVIFADWLRGSGNLLIVDHGNAYISLYSHNQQLLKQSGDWVSRGEALALSGEDGGTGEPGLYFEIRRNSETLNPADWLVSAD
jgi:septal ring factor EnvC (AmiA/AmiB activator)